MILTYVGMERFQNAPGIQIIAYVLVFIGIVILVWKKKL